MLPCLYTVQAKVQNRSLIPQAEPIPRLLQEKRTEKTGDRSQHLTVANCSLERGEKASRLLCEPMRPISKLAERRLEMNLREDVITSVARTCLGDLGFVCLCVYSLPLKPLLSDQGVRAGPIISGRDFNGGLRSRGSQPFF